MRFVVAWIDRKELRRKDEPRVAVCLAEEMAKPYKVPVLLVSTILLGVSIMSLGSSITRWEELVFEGILEWDLLRPQE
jgi:hypothetical protein